MVSSDLVWLQPYLTPPRWFAAECLRGHVYILALPFSRVLTQVSRSTRGTSKSTFGPESEILITMRTSITSLLLSLAVASSAQEEVPGLNQPKDTECELISPVVDGLLAVPSATEFCSSLLTIPTVTVTSLAVETLTLTSIVETLETTTLLSTFTNTDETAVTGTTTLTADAVTVTDTM